MGSMGHGKFSLTLPSVIDEALLESNDTFTEKTLTSVAAD